MKHKFASLLMLAASILPSHAAITFSFLNDTWSTGPVDGGFTRQTGNTSSASSTGTLTKSGVTLTFTATFVGGANSAAPFPANQGAPAGSSLTNGIGSNPSGFLMSTDGNDSAGITSGFNPANGGSHSGAPTTGFATAYQRWHFAFSEPVRLETFEMFDIDNISGTPGFQDILGVEAWTASGPVTSGTGDVNPTFVLGSSLSQSTLNFDSLTGESVVIISPNASTNNPSSTPAVNASITFKDGFNENIPIRAFSLYAFSDINNVHRMTLNQSQFSIVPEPSSSALGIITLGCALLRRRR